MVAAEQTQSLTWVPLQLFDYDQESLPVDDFMHTARMSSAELNDPALEESYLKMVLARLKGARHLFFWNKKSHILILKYKLIISHFLHIKGGINYLSVDLGVGPLYGPEP